jgi:hypothetical protein
MQNIMIDLETLGTGQNSVITAIGACMFEQDTQEIGQEFYMNIDWQSSIDAGLEIDVETIKWWLLQDKKAIDALFKISYPLSDVLREFTAFVTSNCNLTPKVWGNGATFDITILENAYSAVNQKPPWKFWNIRDCRTVEDISSDFINKSSIKREGTHHNALDDAIYQAKYVSAMIRKLILE